MDRVSLIKFTLIALSLPAQYWLSQYWSNNSIQQTEAFMNLVNSIGELRANYLQLEPWKKWYLSMVVEIPKVYRETRVRNTGRGDTTTPKLRLGGTEKVEYDDVLAIEVFNYRKTLTNFGESSLVRTKRPNNALFRVGQVVKSMGWNGVIIGWDETAQFKRENLLRDNYRKMKRFMESAHEPKSNQPHYLLLLDQRNNKEGDENYQNDLAYLAQEDIELLPNYRVYHRLIGAYFSSFDGERFLPKKYLKTVYPED